MISVDTASDFADLFHLNLWDVFCKYWETSVWFQELCATTFILLYAESSTAHQKVAWMLLVSLSTLHSPWKMEFMLTTYLSSSCQVKVQAASPHHFSPHVCFTSRSYERLTRCFICLPFVSPPQVEMFARPGKLSGLFKAGVISRGVLWSAAASSLHWGVLSGMGTQDGANFWCKRLRSVQTRDSSPQRAAKLWRPAFISIISDEVSVYLVECSLLNLSAKRIKHFF